MPRKPNLPVRCEQAEVAPNHQEVREILRKRLTRFSVPLCLGALLIAAPAQATIVVGSDLSQPVAAPPLQAPCETGPAPCSALLWFTRPGNAYPAHSPASGTVVGFNIETATAATVRFEVFDYSGGAKGPPSAVGRAKTPAVSLPAPGTYRVPAALPIKAGDRIGLESTAPSVEGACGQGGDTYWYSPPIAEGVADSEASPADCELLLNAVVEPTATVGFKWGEIYPHAENLGLVPHLPGPGLLTVAGEGIATQTRSVKQAGLIFMRLKVRRAVKEQLRRRDSVTLRITETFAPEGGTPATESKRVRFR